MCFGLPSLISSLVCRSKPTRQLKRLYDTKEAADEGEDDDANGDDDGQDDSIEADLGVGAAPERKYPPLAHMSGLGASEEGDSLPSAVT